MTRIQRLGAELTERQFSRNPLACSINRRHEEAETLQGLKPRDMLILSFLAATFGLALIFEIAEPLRNFIHFLNL